MRTDPRAACSNAQERKLWAFVHDFLAHPMMAITNWSGAAIAFHDWTSHKAWPRPKVRLAQADSFHLEPYGPLRVREVEPYGLGFFAIDYERRNRTFITTARDLEHALEKGIAEFDAQAAHEAQRQ